MINRVIARRPEVLHGVAAPGPPLLGVLLAQIQRGECAADAEVAPQWLVGITECSHGDDATGPRPHTSNRGELTSCDIAITTRTHVDVARRESGGHGAQCCSSRRRHCEQVFARTREGLG